MKNAFVRTSFNNGFEPVKVPIAGWRGNLSELETIFNNTVDLVEANKHKHVEKVEVKVGNKVLFMQRFENAVRL